MKNMRFFYALVTIFALVGGIACHQQYSPPNQAIVLQLQHSSIEIETAQTAFSVVKKRLELLGAENIELTTQENGDIKITYYSDDDISSIKKRLAEEEHFDDYFNAEGNDPNQLPLEDESLSYHIEFFEINKGTDFNLTIKGFEAVPFKSEFAKDVTTLPLFLNQNKSLVFSTGNDHVAYSYMKKVAFSNKDISKAIPEVRAGPTQFILG